MFAFFGFVSEGDYVHWRTIVEKPYIGKYQNLANQVQTCQCVLKQNVKPLGSFLHTGTELDYLWGIPRISIKCICSAVH